VFCLVKSLKYLYIIGWFHVCFENCRNQVMTNQLTEIFCSMNMMTIKVFFYENDVSFFPLLVRCACLESLLLFMQIEFVQ
jgi:hypothetical protein